MSDYDFIEYRLRFKQSLNLPISASSELYPVLYSDWLYKVFESGWKRLFSEDFPYNDIRISSGFPYGKKDSQVLFYSTEKLEYVSVVRDLLATGEMQNGKKCWRFFSRPRAEFNKETARREKRFSTVEIYFKKSAGIWFGARITDSAIQKKFESVIRFIGEEGIGGGRSVGYGAFELANIEEISIYKEEHSMMLALSRFKVPETSITEELFTEIRPMTVGLKSTKTGKKQNYTLFGEGSLMNVSEKIDYLNTGEYIGEDSKKAKDYSKRAAFLFAMPVPAKMCNSQTN
ncbi:MAG: hypothetical protein K8S87_01750 [Planctomycetes bacterium]|nr:hypothetical protein [Planctomycetota bacterium]